LVGVRKEGKNW